MQQDESFEKVEVLKGAQRSVEVLAHDTPPISPNHWTQILPTDPIFLSTKLFWESLHADKQCLKNHIRLMAGYQQLPVTLLFNPCNSHSGEFHDMFGKMSALGWLARVFDKIGLDIEHDVPIWDILPMMCDEWLEKMAHSGRQEELEKTIVQGYELIGQYLERFKPPTIVVLQCSTQSCKETKYSFLQRVSHPLAKVLCSSMDKSLEGNCETIRYRNHEFCVVPGFHPSAINYEPDVLKRDVLSTSLKRTLVSIYQPYAEALLEIEL
ncbi:uncharacterized protein N7518_003592 [Penicillium psychrosexuale]|uniref:uncharacterized protein n=1 Tax=Penicillium psychrosexuale TaxID=1002107 RepID=UPI00254572EC|nr:uncharacterized protein N7518_003592 [Penicillium psychrosexuale]KAJ5801524.1 hypothetical protein N7518_003592 [Penicillium psychrosexuale]